MDIKTYQSLTRVKTNYKGVETLRMKQSRFARLISLLIQYADANGFEITIGDVWAKSGHCKGSLHYKRLALDINLFKNGVYLTTTEAHKPLGEYWESIGGSWGGRFGDGNHYSLEHLGKR